MTDPVVFPAARRPTVATHDMPPARRPSVATPAPTDAVPTALALLCVHPHPDDETIQCGGILARYSESGARVKVVTCTGGEEGENLAGIDLGDVAMAEVRSRELYAALVELGVSEHEFLGYRDSGMPGTASNEDPASFHQADLDEAGRRLAAVIRSFRPDVVVGDDEQGTYGHPDHVKAHEVTSRALELAADPAELSVPGRPWQVRKRFVHALPRSRLIAFHERMLAEGLPSPFGSESWPAEVLPFGVPEEVVTTAIDVRPWLSRKRAALRAHASQVGADSFFFNLPPDVAEAVFGTEYFVRLFGPTDSKAVEEDLFAGLCA
ncbi:MAG: N-acetyl-1-D-myo-inositol-2-amino-2-deoxy-alpha-D-glucopyranoside deacetylase [Nitriliruptorales bacterium]